MIAPTAIAGGALLLQLLLLCRSYCSIACSMIATATIATAGSIIATKTTATATSLN